MFDPQSSLLIRQAPELPELDIERLPERLTKAFAEIVALRLRLGGVASPMPQELGEELSELRRLAATFEAMVALLPEKEHRRATAFVAAQAHHLLHLARRAVTPDDSPLSLGANAIASEISALLLFLMANQFSDATEMAREVAKMRPDGKGAPSLVLDALCALTQGRLSEIPALLQMHDQWPPDSCDAAVEALYLRVLHGLSLLSRYVLNAQDSPTAALEAIEVFKQVQQLSVRPEDWPLGAVTEWRSPPLSAFAGPHHLANLLVGAAECLRGAALSAVPPPKGVPAAAWIQAIRPITEQRPFLWPNHLDALKSGLLQPGISAAISFPTGAGKTTLSELKIASALAVGGAVVYLAPTHALVAQTKADLSLAFPSFPVRESLLVEDFYSEVGESYTLNSAQIVVMTPERCLALLSVEEAGFEAVRLVIFDECHLVHPKEKGQNRRSLDAMFAILHLTEAAPNADWLLLSAMMSNSEEIADWLSSLTGRTCLTLELTWKPTRQARGCLVYDKAELDELRQYLRRESLATKQASGKFKAPGVAVKRNLKAHAYCFMGLQQTWQNRELRNYALLRLLEMPVALSAVAGKQDWYPTPNKNEVAATIASQCIRIGLKVLLFVQSTRDTEAVARRIHELSCLYYDDIDLNANEKAMLSIAIEEMGSSDAVMCPWACAGSHSSNLLAVERELAESLFRRVDGIGALAATATLAQGMNLPADIVLIVGDERFDAESEGFAPLDPHELLNAAGRAGRAGLVAQGLVIVIPHTFVDFDPAKRQIGSKWIDLQEHVFSQTDQCLRIVDPFQNMLDKVQEAAAESDPDVRYFLRRLPRDTDDSSVMPSAFLRSTLAAWHARREGGEAGFETLISKTLARRTAMDPLASAETWYDEMAYRTGVPVHFIEALHSELLRKSDSLPEGTEDWVRWFFSWIGTDSRLLESVFGHRLPKRLMDELLLGDLVGGRLADAVWAWMSGETLTNINVCLGGKKERPGHCELARKFVLKVIPDLAFAAGLVTRIWRRQIKESGVGMPLSLAVLALCIREGLGEPESVALRTLLVDQRISRAGVISLWNKIQPHSLPRNSTETFAATRRRVRSAMRYL